MSEFGLAIARKRLSSREGWLAWLFLSQRVSDALKVVMHACCSFHDRKVLAKEVVADRQEFLVSPAAILLELLIPFAFQ